MQSWKTGSQTPLAPARGSPEEAALPAKAGAARRRIKIRLFFIYSLYPKQKRETKKLFFRFPWLQLVKASRWILPRLYRGITRVLLNHSITHLTMDNRCLGPRKEKLKDLSPLRTFGPRPPS